MRGADMQSGFVLGDRGLGTSGDTHPAWMMAHAEVAPYLIVGASAVGKIHLARQLPRDDAFVIRSIGPWLAVAVADGVGSRPLSRYGATYVVESLSALALRQLVPSLQEVLHRDCSSDDFVPSSVPVPMSLSADELKDLAPPPTGEEFACRLVSEHLSVSPVEGDGSLPIVNEHIQQAGSMAWWLSHGERRQNPAQNMPATSLKTFKPTTEQEQKGADAVNLDLRQIIHYAFDNTYRGLVQHANNLDVTLADLSCTALILLLNMETGSLAVGQIGDGALLGLTAQGTVQELIQAPETEDHQSVYTINRPNYAKYLAIDVVEPSDAHPFRALYVMTDGISTDLLYSPQPVEDWVKSIDAVLQASSSPAKAAAGMLNWLSSYEVKGSWDDRTLIVITQRESSYGDNSHPTGQSEPAGSNDHP
jgi:Protein phosphatase 2C